MITHNNLTQTTEKEDTPLPPEVGLIIAIAKKVTDEVPADMTEQVFDAIMRATFLRN